ncbi:Acetate--CoA ligase [ADP-forming] [Candidatus Bilamarchaeum dharawalense]|uniref:Acetate--CoA ligase [ADP-forming] n=1 Tax=Candidatus Bilamarchaeum dharawalense TaxID=2885759 RepID=A0A5E4LSR0_9ARCH|nr:Acetate--CoA ligase [ADP-forming] [Candidatus Bilamarchaeum dharawalense]
MNKNIQNLKFVFAPRTVAIVGASATANKIGNVIIRNFLDARFQGDIFPINPKYTELFGLKCYQKVSDVPGTIDCVIIATPAETVPMIVEDCVKKKVGGVIVLSGGFEEVNRTDLAQKIAEIAKKNNLPIIGPNCLGVYNPYTKVDSIFLPRYKLERPKAGGIAFVTQSGAVGSTVMDLAAFYGIGISKFISYGNATVLDESDYLEYLMHDKDTKTIILYLEGAKDGRKLLQTMKKVNKIKPIIALKAGKGVGGQAAARSHTGNIAGSYLAYNAAFKQAKVTEADGIIEVFDFVKIFDQTKPKGNRIAVLTNGGGIGVLTTDYIESEGLSLAKFSDETKKELAKILPSYGTVANPLDLVADAGVEAYEKAIDVMMNDPNIDALIVIVLTQTPPIDERIIHVLTKASDDKRKPIATISIGGTYTEVYRKILESKGVPSYNSPRAAVKAIERLITYSRYWEQLKRK